MSMEQKNFELQKTSIILTSQSAFMYFNVLFSSRFIGTGIQYCFTRNLHIYSNNFYFTYFLRVITGALACVFICMSVNHFGRRGMLLLSAIITGLSSLLLLALTQCMPFVSHFLTVSPRHYRICSL